VAANCGPFGPSTSWKEIFREKALDTPYRLEKEVTPNSQESTTAEQL